MSKLEKINPWWIIVFVVVLQFIAVPFNYAAKNWPGIGGFQDVMNHAFTYSLLNKMPIEIKIVAQIITLIVIFLFFWKRNFRLLGAYAFLTFISAAIVQNIGISTKYGLCTVTVNLIQFPLVGLAFIYDAFNGGTDTKYRSKSIIAYLALPLALFAFWAPESWNGLFKYLFTSGTTFGFCLMIPVYLALLFMSYPRISPLTLIVSGSIGFIISLYNMYGAFVSGWGVWVAVLHLPLMITSFVAILLTFKIQKLNLSSTFTESKD